MLGLEFIKEIFIGCVVTLCTGLITFYFRSIQTALRRMENNSNKNRKAIMQSVADIRVLSEKLNAIKELLAKNEGKLESAQTDIRKYTETVYNLNAQLKAIWQLIPGANERTSDKLRKEV